MAGISSWKEESLSDATLQKAQLELNEEEGAVASAINALRDAVKIFVSEHKDAGLPSNADEASDGFLKLFLRARKYNIERALKLLVSYWNFRGKHTELIEGVSLDSIRPIVEHGLPMVLKERDSQGRRIIIFRPALLQPDKMSIDDIQRTVLYVLDALIKDEETQVNGFVMIEDWSKMTMLKVLMFDRSSVKKIMDILQECFPGRFKEIHLVNNPWFFNIIWGIAKPFMKEKLRRRIKIHGSNIDALHEHIPKLYLPADLGGSQPPYDCQSLLDYLAVANVERPPQPSVAACEPSKDSSV